jgi:hypothetical protein
VVLFNGGPLSIDSLVDPAPAIIEGFYPGYNGAQVLTSAIFGDVNEFGRLPYTVYPSAYASQVDMGNMSMQVSGGVEVGRWVLGVFSGRECGCSTILVWLCALRPLALRWVLAERIGTTQVRGARVSASDVWPPCLARAGKLATTAVAATVAPPAPAPASSFPLPPAAAANAGTPLFSFGQGLSYTTFSLACTNVTSDTGVDITCGVTNTGSRDGDDVLLVFHSVGSDISGGVDHPVPIKRLVDFGRVAVAVGDTEQLTFSVTPGVLFVLCARRCVCVCVCLDEVCGSAWVCRAVTLGA